MNQQIIKLKTQADPLASWSADEIELVEKSNLFFSTDFTCPISKKKKWTLAM